MNKGNKTMIKSSIIMILLSIILPYIISFIIKKNLYFFFVCITLAIILPIIDYKKQQNKTNTIQSIDFLKIALLDLNQEYITYSTSIERKSRKEIINTFETLIKRQNDLKRKYSFYDIKELYPYQIKNTFPKKLTKELLNKNPKSNFLGNYSKLTKMDLREQNHRIYLDDISNYNKKDNYYTLFYPNPNAITINNLFPKLKDKEYMKSYQERIRKNKLYSILCIGLCTIVCVFLVSLYIFIPNLLPKTNVITYIEIALEFPNILLSIILPLITIISAFTCLYKYITENF